MITAVIILWTLLLSCLLVYYGTTNLVSEKQWLRGFLDVFYCLVCLNRHAKYLLRVILELRPQSQKCWRLWKSHELNLWIKNKKNLFHFSLSNLSSLLKYYPFTCAKPVQNNKLTSITSYLQMTWNHCLKIQTASHCLTDTYKFKWKGSEFTELNFRNSTKSFYE